MQELLSKESFDRFKLIKSIINNYPYINIDTIEIQKIKHSYREYTASFRIINTLLHIEDSQFIDKSLLDELNTFNEYIHINEPSIDIKISYKSKPNNKLINIIYSTVRLFQKLYGNKKVIIRIALTEQNRILTAPIIGSINVNGGQTDLRSIDIFRKEEVVKVLMHELCHFYELDCGDINKNQSVLMDRFNIKTPNFLSVQEAFTEYLAMLHHIALISYYTKKSIRLIYHYEKILVYFKFARY